MPTTPVSISLPSDVLTRLDAAAAHGRVARSWLITTILAGWLDTIDQRVDCGSSARDATNGLIAASLDARHD